MLAVVSAALTAPLALLAGKIVFSVRVRLGAADAQAGFEPNFFIRHVGLPVSTAVLVITFCVAFWRLRRSGATNSRTSRPASYPET